MIGEIAIGVCLGLCMFYALPTLCSLAADVLVAVFPWVMGLIGIALVVIIGIVVRHYQPSAPSCSSQVSSEPALCCSLTGSTPSASTFSPFASLASNRISHDPLQSAQDTP